MFTDRQDAGRALARLLQSYRGPGTVVLGIPRGGVVVAREVAASLGAPLDVVITRKLGSPWHPEYAVGAIGEGGVRIVDDDALRASRVSAEALERVEATERAELERRGSRYRGSRPRLDLHGARVIIVDDGVATGATATAACRAVRALGAGEIILATPVAPPEWTDRLRGEADALVAAATPSPFWAVGQWYDRFEQTTDAEVLACLDGSRAAPS